MKNICLKNHLKTYIKFIRAGTYGEEDRNGGIRDDRKRNKPRCYKNNKLL